MTDAESIDSWITSIPAAGTDAASSAGRTKTLTLDPHLSQRARIVRGLLILATIVLPLLVMLRMGAADVTARHATASSLVSHAIPLRGLGVAPWHSALGSADMARGALDIHPVSTDANVIYACWVAPRVGMSGLAPLHVAASDDGALTWKTLASPVPRATRCRLLLNDSDSRRLVLDTQLETAAGCTVSHTFASIDAGKHWSELVLPDAHADACSFSLSTLSSANGAMLLWTNRSGVVNGQALSAQLWGSVDGGVTWRSLSAGLPPSSIEALVAGRTTGALLVLLRRSGGGAPAAAAGAYELWSCEAGCAHWYWFGGVPGRAPIVYASSGSQMQSGAGWGSLYAVDLATTADASGQFPISATVYVSAGTPGSSWRALSPGCGGGDRTNAPSDAVSHVVGVGPNGLLVMEVHDEAMQVGPSDAVSRATGVLCAWDPAGSRWLMPFLIEPPDSSPLAATLNEQVANIAPRLAIWFITRSGDLWRANLSANDWWPRQPSSRCERCY